MSTTENLPTTLQCLASEFLGTFALVFAGTGAVVINAASITAELPAGAVTHVGVALTFGLIVLVMIYTVGEISGAHLNPAVTLGFWIAGRFAGGRVLPYVVVQCVAALAASGVLKFLYPESTSYGQTTPAESTTAAFVLEVLLTFFLMFVILAVSSGAKEKGITAGIVVGGYIALAAMFAGPACGASMNPARSLGPAAVAADWSALWVYLTAPVLGAALSVPAYWCVHGPHAETTA